MTARSLAAGAALALVLAGCGDGADDTTDSTAAATATDAGEADGGATSTTEASPAGGDTAEGTTVTVQGIAFQDASVTVPAGTPVTWDNQDTVGHTVTSGGPGDATGVFDESLPASGSVTITVDEPGTYAYSCQIHPSMTAELVVEDA